MKSAKCLSKTVSNTPCSAGWSSDWACSPQRMRLPRNTMYPDRQRFGCRDPGGAVCHGSEGKRLRRGRGYHLDACRNLQLHESNHAFEERNIGHQSHQDLGVYGEVPILDFSNYSLASGSSDRPAITVTGSWMHLKGLEIANGKVGSSGSHSYSMLRTKNASNNTFELLNIHNGFGPGFFIDTGTGGNLVLNCDSHDNYDVNGSQGDGQNGDGFGVHYQTTGPSTIVRGCRSWHNSDDGYDLISQEVPVTVENNWAFKCGYGSSGNGNGSRWEAARPVFGILYKTMLRGVTRRRASMPTILRAATPGTTTRLTATALSTTCWLAVSIPPAT